MRYVLRKRCWKCYGEPLESSGDLYHGITGRDHKILANLDNQQSHWGRPRMPVDLDDLKLLSKIDRSNMLSAVDRFADIFLRSRDEGDGSLTKTKASFQSLVLMGMGGSASAADVVLDWLKGSLPIPALVHREPGLPAFVNSRTLFIALSYSGETSETLAAVREAENRGRSLFGIGNGGATGSFFYPFKAT